MAILRLLHRWLGGFLATVIGLIALSGGVLVIKEPILGLVWPTLSKPLTIGQQARYSQTIEQIQQQFQTPSVVFLRFPRVGMNAFHVWLSDGSEAYIDPTNAKVICHWTWYKSLTSILFELHAHLFMGSIGETIVGIIGIATLLFLLSGTILWWPRRHSLRITDIKPRFAMPLKSHQTIGIVAVLPILLFVITGTIMVFYKPVAQVVTSIIDQYEPLLPTKVVAETNKPHRTWAEIMPVINSTLPSGELQSWAPGLSGNAAYVFRKRMPEEWHVFGRSFILLDPYKAEVVQVIDARRQQTGMKIMEKIYPLHASKIGGAGYKIVAVTTALFLFLLALLGLISFTRRIRKKWV